MAFFRSELCGKITLVYALVFSMLLLSCSRVEKDEVNEQRSDIYWPAYFNLPNYNLVVGDTLRIFYSNSSCCLYCISKSEELNCLEHIGHEIIYPGSPMCEGCEYYGVNYFIARSIGRDTVFSFKNSPNHSCDSFTGKKDFYVVEIRNSDID